MNNLDINVIEQYVEILNNYEKGNYKITENDEEVLKKLNLTIKNNHGLGMQVTKLKQMSISQRNEYLKLFDKKSDNKENNDSFQSQVSECFGIGVNEITTTTLNNGKCLYIFYEKSLGRNVVLEDNDNSYTLIHELQSIKEEKQLNGENFDSDEIIEDKRVNSNLEVSFIPCNMLNEYSSVISSLDQDRQKQIMCLYENRDEFLIEYINIDNIIGLDRQGNVYEVYYDNNEHRYKIDKASSKSNIDDKVEDDYTDEQSTNNNDLDDMLNDSIDEDNDINESIEISGNNMKKTLFDNYLN